MALETKWFAFAEGVSVQSAPDPSVMIDIEAGRHLVVFDNMVSRSGNAAECEIGWTGASARVLRSVLEQLCRDGHAAFVGDA